MAIANPRSIKTSHGATHPPTPERFLALEMAVAEIKSKKDKGLELRPNLKEKAADENIPKRRESPSADP